MRPGPPSTTPSTAGVSKGRSAFKDPFAIERLDDREDYGEDRYILIGTTEGEVLTVVYIERDALFRIISARQATRREHFIEND
jgi:uncharacterized DUF497 family protein